MKDKIIIEICNHVSYIEGLFQRKENAKSDIERKIWIEKIENAFSKQEKLIANYNDLTVVIEN